MAVGKRLDTSEPLTEHDVAERLDKAALRVLRILMDVRQAGMMEAVKSSRYLTNVVDLLIEELGEWGWTAERPLTRSADATPMPPKDHRHLE